MEIYLANPTYLWLLVPIPIFAAIMLLFLTKGKKEIETFISFHALEFLFKKGEFVTRYIKKNLLVFILRVAIYTLIVLVIAESTIYYRGIPQEQAIVVAIDTSGSMLAEDISPNRLEAVKETIDIFLENVHQKSKIAILSFSGNAYIEQELSNKEDSIRSIGKIQISHISGTSIGTTLRTAANILKEEIKPKLIILISDGNENVMEEGELNRVIDGLNKDHITVDVIGVGKIEGAKLPGTELLSTLNEPLLENIAKKTDGIYQRAKTKKGLIESYKKFAATKLKVPIRLRIPLVILTILLLSVDYMFIRLA